MSSLRLKPGDFFVTHGHMENVGHDLQKLCYKAEEAGCIGAIFGHTHRSAYVFAEDMYLMNPGSLQRPRDGLRRHFRYPGNRTGKRVWQDIQI